MTYLTSSKHSWKEVKQTSFDSYFLNNMQMEKQTAFKKIKLSKNEILKKYISWIE